LPPSKYSSRTHRTPHHPNCLPVLTHASLVTLILSFFQPLSNRQLLTMVCVFLTPSPPKAASRWSSQPRARRTTPQSCSFLLVILYTTFYVLLLSVCRKNPFRYSNRYSFQKLSLIYVDSTILLSYCPTVLPSYSPTVRPADRSTVRPSGRSTVQLFTVLLFDCPCPTARLYNHSIRVHDAKEGFDSRRNSQQGSREGF
jgi:hypothetical protein